VKAGHRDSKVQHLLVPVDGSELAEGALQAACDLAGSLAARLTVFYAPPTADAYALGRLPRFVDRAEIGTRTLEEIHALIGARGADYLRHLVAHLRPSGAGPGPVQVAWECVESDEPHRAILEAAARLGCDLIVMACHGRRGLDALLLGSETQKVLTHGTVPVLVWRRPPGGSARR
jgi:nucleotide-binding universal stress UspA family protein